MTRAHPTVNWVPIAIRDAQKGRERLYQVLTYHHQLNYALARLLPMGYAVNHVDLDRWEIDGDVYQGSVTDAVVQWGYDNYHTEEDWP